MEAIQEKKKCRKRGMKGRVKNERKGVTKGRKAWMNNGKGGREGERKE